jgi:hypothetical protein
VFPNDREKPKRKWPRIGGASPELGYWLNLSLISGLPRDMVSREFPKTACPKVQLTYSWPEDSRGPTIADRPAGLPADQEN